MQSKRVQLEVLLNHDGIVLPVNNFCVEKRFEHNKYPDKISISRKGSETVLSIVMSVFTEN